MAAPGGILAPIALGILRRAIQDASKVLRKKVSSLSKAIKTQAATANTTNCSFAAPIRSVGSNGQPVHPAAAFRQQRQLFSRWQAAHQNVGTAMRRFLSTVEDAEARRAAQLDRSKFPVSQTSRAVFQLTGRAPFAHALRPNLTGGALPRSQGGYGITGGGARHFSHTPAAPAQVVQNVSQGIRAFLLQGKRARFDGMDSRGRKSYRTVSALEDDTARTMAAMPHFVPGSFVDFRLTPTITAMSPLAAAFPFTTAEKKTIETAEDFVPTAYAYAANVQQKRISGRASAMTLTAAGFLDELSVDFARALKDLNATLGDIRRLSALGDLTIEFVPGDATISPTLRVRFPGVGAETVECLCDDMGVSRGLIFQDKEFESSAGIPVVFKFPFAPGCGYDADVVVNDGCCLNSEQHTLKTPSSLRRLSVGSLEGHDFLDGESDTDMSDAEEAFILDEFSENPWLSSPESGGYGSPAASENFEGVGGIYRFIDECDRVREWQPDLDASLMMREVCA